MKLSHKIFSIIVTTFFLSFLAQAGESNSTNANTLVSSSNSNLAVSGGYQAVPHSQKMSTNSRVYVAQGGGDGGFPPDPQLAKTENLATFCVFSFCFTVIWP